LPIHPKYYSSQDSARKWMGEDVILLYHQISLSWGLLFCPSHGSCFDGLPVAKSFDMFFKLSLKFKTHHQKGGRRILLLPLAYFLLFENCIWLFVYFWLLKFLVKSCNRTAQGVATHFLAPLAKLDGTFRVVQKWGYVLKIGAEKENRISRSFPKSWGELYALLWMQSDQLAGHIFPSFFKNCRSEFLKRWIGVHIRVSCQPLMNEKYFSICQPWWGWWA